MLPEKTVERLSQYRRLLLNCSSNGKLYIYSHELAELLNLTAVQVRRDIMLIGYASTVKKGYKIKELIERIGKIIDNENCMNVAVVGAGNLGKALSTYFKGKRNKLDINAVFDIDKEKIGKIIAGVKCYDIEDVEEKIKELNISIAILTVPPEIAQETAERLTKAGIAGILNFTSVSITSVPTVYLEEYDMITSIEKVAYFVKKNAEQKEE